MYSWGDDTSAWKNPGSYDYGSAKAPYLKDLEKEAAKAGPKTYTQTSTPNLKLVDPKGKTITTTSKNPIIFGIDGTGSLQTWPGEFFDRAPLLYQTLSKYRDDVEISFSVIGDTVSDDWPVQVSDFGKGVTLDSFLNALKPEGRGGPGIRESYELWAHYINQHAQTPNAISPFLFILGDEKFYDKVDPKQVKQYLGDTLQAPIPSIDVWKSLSQKFDVYLLRKQYPGHDEEITTQWKEAIGEQKIIPVYDSSRVVDIAMGLVAKKWGNYGDFENNLSARQDEKGIASVMASLKLAPGIEGVGDMKSMTAGAIGSKKSIGLLEK